MNWIIEAIGRLFGYHLDDEQMLRAQLKEAREELIEATARCEEWDARRTMFAKRIVTHTKLDAMLAEDALENAYRRAPENRPWRIVGAVLMIASGLLVIYTVKGLIS